MFLSREYGERRYVSLTIMYVLSFVLLGFFLLGFSAISRAADSVPPEIALWSYVAAFTLGILLLLLSLLPLLRLPNVAVRFAADELPTWRMLGEAFRNRSLRFLMLHNWWLAFANGLTQAAFFSYLFGPLSVSLGTLYVLFGTMRIVKIPISALSGFLCDRFGNKALLFWGVLTASLAMPFWLLGKQRPVPGFQPRSEMTRKMR